MTFLITNPRNMQHDSRTKTSLSLFSFWMIPILFSIIQAQQNQRPNVILIMADDLGYEALGCNGSSSYQTPAFDRLAAKGMRFTNCYSQPVCTPSRVKIMTGRSNARNYRQFGVLIPGEITFGNVLKQAGYQTCIAGKWQLTGNANGGLKGVHWNDCGFDESCMWAYAHYQNEADRLHYESTSIFGSKKASRFWNPSLLENGHYRETTGDDFGPDIYSKFITDFISRNKDDTFFAYYPMALTHGPFVPTPHTKNFKESDKTKSNSKYFGDMVRYSGYLVEKIINHLDSEGIAENTLVLFTGDNGTGRGIESWLGDRLVMGGKALPIDAGCHVPMLAYWKGTIQPGSVCSDLIDFSDFLPTLAQLTEANLPTDRTLDGRSFLPQLTGLQGNPRDAVLVHYDKDPSSEEPKFRRVRFAYDGRYKLYSNGAFYDVINDWDEQKPLADGQLTESMLKAKTQLSLELKTLPHWNPDNSYFAGQQDPETLKRLSLAKKTLKSKTVKR